MEASSTREAQASPLSLPQVSETRGMASSSISAGRECQDSDNSNGQVLQQTTTTVINVERGNVFTGTNYGNFTQLNIEEFQVLRNLPIHPDISGHLSDYLPNSRADDEAQILQWIDSPHPSDLMLCVLGKVGVGKSTFAKHLASRLRQQGRLAAEIYLGFALPDWSAESVVRMAAGQLCGTYPELTRAVSEAIRLDVGPSVSLETRIQTLILEPIQSLHLPGPLVVLLDALDQWAPHPILAKALSCLATETRLIRFIALGRPGLEDRFQNVPVKLYDLQVVSKTVMGDYFRLQFEQVDWEHKRKPTSRTIEQLVDKANGLFIWSSILCSILEDQVICPKPHDTLAAILQSQHSIGDDDVLVYLYHSAINLRFPKPAHKAKLKVYLEAVLVLQEPLPALAFASLVSMEVALVRKIQADLGALQTSQAKDTQDMVYPASSMFHLSLLEYLQSPKTPSHLAFPIDTFVSHSCLGLACLDELRHPLSSSQSSFTSPLQKYAMRYWPIHVAHGTPSVTPTSNDEWKATPHSVILDGFSVQQWKHWAQSYLQVVCPGGVEDLSTEELILPQAVTTTTHPSTRKSIRSFLGKLLHKPKDKALVTPTHNTHQHLISHIVQPLYQSRATEGTPDAIAVAEVATRLQYQSSGAWLQLGRTYYDAAKINASSHLVENAVHSCRYAADLSGKEGHEARQTLGSCLALRVSRLGIQEDLDEAILVKRAVLLLTPLGHPDRASSLNNLAASLDSHHKHTGATESLDEAILLHREALSLRPPGHPDRAFSLNNLAISLNSRFKHTGTTENLDEAIVLHREALSLLLAGHPNRASSLDNLASSLDSRFEHTGTIESLDEAIVLHQEALSLRLPGHPDRALYLNNLANSLHYRFKHTGTTENLDEAIMLHQEALSLLPPGHPNRASSLNNLAYSLYSRFEHTGTTETLDEAIVLHREALSLLPAGHPDRAACLNNLAYSLKSCSETGKTDSSLDEAIMFYREALSLRPPGHPRHAMTLSNLSATLRASYKLTGNIDCLNEANSLNASR